MAYFVFIDRERISWNYGDLVFLNRLFAEFIHVAAVGKRTPYEQAALRSDITYLLGKSVVDIAAHKVAFLLVYCAKFVEMRLAVNSSDKAV